MSTWCLERREPEPGVAWTTMSQWHGGKNWRARIQDETTSAGADLPALTMLRARKLETSIQEVDQFSAFVHAVAEDGVVRPVVLPRHVGVPGISRDVRGDPCAWWHRETDPRVLLSVCAALARPGDALHRALVRLLLVALGNADVFPPAEWTAYDEPAREVLRAIEHWTTGSALGPDVARTWRAHLREVITTANELPLKLMAVDRLLGWTREPPSTVTLRSSFQVPSAAAAFATDAIAMARAVELVRAHVLFRLVLAGLVRG